MKIRRINLPIKKILTIILALAVAVGFAFSFSACTSDDYDIDALIQDKANNVVRIREAGATESSGTGTLIHVDYVPYSGYHAIIITCYHVVRSFLTSGNRFIEVALNNYPGYFRYAALIGFDDTHDIAIFETTFVISKHFADTVEWASGKALTEGQRVLTFGDAGGNGIVTSGGVVDAINITEHIGGAVNRTMTLIRVTSNIVAGKSGGPTFDMQGRLIGINIGTREGNGYLIPADDVKRVFDEVMAER